MARHYKNNGHYKENNGGRHYKRGAKPQPRVIRSVKKLGSAAKTAVVSVAGAAGSKLGGIFSKVFRRNDRYKSKYGKRKKKVIKFSRYSRYSSRYSEKEKSKPARLRHESPKEEKPKREALRFEASQNEKPKREPLSFETFEPERPLIERRVFEDGDEKPKRETIKFELPEEEILKDLTLRFDLPEDQRPITETLKFELPEEEKPQRQTESLEEPEEKEAPRRASRFKPARGESAKKRRTGKNSGENKKAGIKAFGRKGKRKERFTAENLPTTEQLVAELKWERNKKSSNGLIRNTVFALITVAAAAVLTATLFLPILQIYGTSMTPTLSEGEIVVSVKGSGFEQGDVISFYYNNKILVKRVIAFEGDFVNIEPDGTVLVNNKELDEPYLTEKDLGECDIKLPYQVPAGKIFVLGDHRKTSVDSRSSVMGCVAEEQIVGKIVFRVWPPDRVGGVK